MNILSHKAKWVMRSPGRWLENGIVEVASGQIVDVRKQGKRLPQGKFLDHGHGVLMPAFVNCHTHLTLSILKNRVRVGEGFAQWVKSILVEREKISVEDAKEASQREAISMGESGVGLVGEFGPIFPVLEVMRKVGLEGVVWREFLGEDRDIPRLDPPKEEIVESYAGHGPHTTNPSLLRRLKLVCAEMKTPFSIHLAESQEELQFLEEGRGPWADLLAERGMNFSRWKCFGKRPVRLAHELGLLDENTVAVHLLEVEREEIELLSESGVWVCVCPRSNWILHGKLPKVADFLKASVRLCLGTDSLASVESLSILDEIRFLAENFQDIDPAAILKIATMNGAMALGRRNWGMVERGMRAKLIFMEVEAPSPQEGEEAILWERRLKAKLIG